MYRDIGQALYRRSVEVVAADGQKSTPVELPSWTWIVVLLNFLTFLPVFVIVYYTLRQVYPILAIVEDENPPAYEPAAVDDEAPGVPKSGGFQPMAAAPRSSQALTSSVRRIHRLLKAHGGFRGNFRGLACFLCWTWVASIPTFILTAALGASGVLLGCIFAYVALVQLRTAWVHIIISKPSERRFWSRLPPFRRTLEATWRPILLNIGATWLSTMVPSLLATLLSLKSPDWKMGGPITTPPMDFGTAWRTLVVNLGYVMIVTFVVVPAEVILVRVQASLLPEEDETIIPFDRSFQGTLEPAVVGGKGYVSVRDAWATFSTAAWRRLLTLYVKIWAISIAVIILLGAVFLPQLILIISKFGVSRGN